VIDLASTQPSKIFGLRERRSGEKSLLSHDSSANQMRMIVRKPAQSSVHWLGLGALNRGPMIA